MEKPHQEQPKYKLGFDESNESSEFLQPYEMTYEQFHEEFERVMEAVRAKEKKGRLDPNAESYEPLSQEERELMARDWKIFSRSRGFSEEDIEEYERWLVLSGQRDDLHGTINDPWRRIDNFGHDKQIYLRHIEKAVADDKILSEDVLKSFNEIKDSLSDQMARFRRKPPAYIDQPEESRPSQPQSSESDNNDDLW